MKILKLLVFCFVCLFVCCSCGGSLSGNNAVKYDVDNVLSKNEPVTINIWHYYSAAQKEKFDRLVDSFNASEGAKYGVYVRGIRRAGNASEISSFLEDALAQKLGADEIPDIFSAYPDTAYKFNEQDLLLDLSDFFTQKEKDEYVTNFLYSSGFGIKNEIKLFPVAKATEVFVLNKTAWIPFAESMGVSYSDLLTWEGVAKVAELYYKWTDSLTVEPDDGKPFFGRDALSNYILTGTYEMGNNIFNVLENGDVEFLLDKKVLRTCWDNYYVPFVKGFFTAKGRFRSDDLKTGDIIACVTSTSSAIYLPSKVIDSSGNFNPIELEVLPIPHFKNAKHKTIVQQGAGLAVLKSNIKRETASVLFLKWFTDMQKYPEFAVSTGYLPVKKKELEKEAFIAAFCSDDACILPVIQDALKISIETMKTSELYFQPGFKNSNQARNILSDLLQEKAKKDREKLLAKIKAGKNYNEAVKDFLGDDDFEAWFEQLGKKLFDLK
ncbi:MULTISPECIES: extracellular solute-binding protein [unclassified Treponema]|uniref:extracellular solute-binding protein n=1 Tax=unclassified Treponema TaxID=2638727 RepID=UPI0020A4A784|nr:MULTISPECIES: extracellular solute-binding protein [unclassified Treponema]UTC67702.1 extracellular solute-binding protein [Treponema sp. OMZ 789]UTC70430.1 extracellular solute-binding protein [Treponema sp. OMZ 790]UTC73143.1 extracellular solute-binding protein [Treponema sp. OMZ 791]